MTGGAGSRSIGPVTSRRLHHLLNTECSERLTQWHYNAEHSVSTFVRFISTLTQMVCEKCCAVCAHSATETHLHNGGLVLLFVHKHEHEAHTRPRIHSMFRWLNPAILTSATLTSFLHGLCDINDVLFYDIFTALLHTGHLWDSRKTLIWHLKTSALT